MTKPPKFPKSLAACADLLYKTREERLRLAKAVKELDEYETALEEHLIDKLPVSDATGVAGKIARVQIIPKVVPTVKDWDALWKYIFKTKATEFLQRRISVDAVTERWEAGKEVPGVERFNAKKVSVTKV